MSDSWMEPWRPVGRGLVLLAVSAGVGAVCGVLGTGQWLVIGFSAVLAGMYVGAIIGTLVAPVAMVALWRVNLRPAMPILVVPAAVTAALFGFLGPLGLGQLLSLLSVPVFIACQVIARRRQYPPPRRLPPPGICPACKYDRTGLARCPECGRLAEVPGSANVP